MTEPLWPGIVVLLLYVGLGVALGVVSNRWKARRTVASLTVTIVLFSVASAWSASGGGDVAALFAGFMYVLSFWSAILAVVFALGRYGARLVLSHRR